MDQTKTVVTQEHSASPARAVTPTATQRRNVVPATAADAEAGYPKRIATVEAQVGARGKSNACARSATRGRRGIGMTGAGSRGRIVMVAVSVTGGAKGPVAPR